MLVLENVLISTEIASTNFICNINKCKGACCWEGDFGAPVTPNEENNLKHYIKTILPFLSVNSQAIIENKGVAQPYDNNKFRGTTLLDNGACVFLSSDKDGIGYCTIESMHNMDKIPIQKPLSCRLYPIRVTKDKRTGMEFWNYDKWDICNPACNLGDSKRIALYEFLKESIIAYKGKDFYAQMDKLCRYYTSTNDEL